MKSYLEYLTKYDWLWLANDRKNIYLQGLIGTDDFKQFAALINGEKSYEYECGKNFLNNFNKFVEILSSYNDSDIIDVDILIKRINAEYYEGN